MVWLVGIALVQIACAVHVIRTGRNQVWIMVVMMLPLAGAAAYVLMEVLPGFQGNRHVRTARAKAIAAIDPERDLRDARDALGLVDSAHNRIAVADALSALDRHAESLPLYREALARAVGSDDRTKAKLARALFETADYDAAEALLGEIEEPRGISERDRLTMLRARILERRGKSREAIALYEDLATRVAGEEARCRLAGLLIETGQGERARPVLEEVEQRMKRLDRQQRAAEADMYDWAMGELRRLRGQSA